MIKNEKSRIWVNRIATFIIAGGAMFLIMNYGVTQKLRNELDSTKYEATRLYNEAKAYFENKDYDSAKKTLTTLFEKRPGSNEATEGKLLYTQMETTQKERDIKWNAAEEGIREEWAIAISAQWRADFLKEGEKLEENMETMLSSEWEKVKDKIREERQM